MDGWVNKILKVDLTEKECSTYELNPTWMESFIGGRGLGIKVYIDEVDPSIDPLNPENPLIFSTGPLTGTGAVCGSLCTVISKSPLTNAIACGRMKGHFGSELKFAGYDLIVIHGKSESPVYLSIMDDKVTLKPALHLWGRGTKQTEHIISSDFDDPWIAKESCVASIGPAGEAQINMSIITNEGHRVTSGAGLGAVMGSKNLKAIVIRGTKGVSVAKDQILIQVVTNILNRARSKPITSQMLPKFGTSFLIKILYEKGLLPINNFQRSIFGHIDEVSGKALVNSFHLKSMGCFACPIACVKFSQLEGEGAGVVPDYEAMAALGHNLAIYDLGAIVKAHHICTDLGIDPVSAGSIIACAIELYEKGWLSGADFKEPLNFGNGEVVIRLLKEIGRTEGFGAILGKGNYEIGERFGHSESCMTVKGQGLPAYDIRGIQGFGLHLATSNNPTDSMGGYTIIDEILGVHDASSPSDTNGKAAKVKLFQDLSALMDSMGVCIYLLMGVWIKQIFPMFKSVTAMDVKLEDILLAGERAWNLERLFNLKAGFANVQDTLPNRILKEPIREGPAEGNLLRLEKMLPEYYRLRGWDETGTPSSERLTELGLK